MMNWFETISPNSGQYFILQVSHLFMKALKVEAGLTQKACPPPAPAGPQNASWNQQVSEAPWSPKPPTPSAAKVHQNLKLQLIPYIPQRLSQNV